MSTCPVCLEKYDRAERKPRSLPCGHALCQNCVSILAGQTAAPAHAQETPDNFYRPMGCPQCREPVPDWLALPVNYPFLTVSTLLTATTLFSASSRSSTTRGPVLVSAGINHCSCLPQSTLCCSSSTVSHRVKQPQNPQCITVDLAD